MKISKLFLYTFFINYLFSDIIITEIGDPNDGAHNRFIEIYNSGNSSVALTNYYIIRWTNGNAGATSNINLSSYTIAAKSFLVFAPDAENFEFTVGGNATLIDVSGGGPADSNGDDNMAIVKEASGQTFTDGNSATYDIVDVFGNPGTDGSGNWHEFEDGRAERVLTQTAAVTSSTSNIWNCWSDSEVFLAGVDQNSGTNPINAEPATRTAYTSNGFDPGAWDGHKAVTISGNAGFRMLSAPVSNGTYTDLLSELWTQGMTGSDAAEASGDNVWSWTLVSGGAGNWSVASNLGNTMTPGAGILVYAFADNNNDGTDDLPVSLSVSGTENSGDVRYPSGSGTISDTRYGFAGNPYYQTIDWDDVAKTYVSATVYVYDDAKSGGAGYISWNGSSGDVSNGLIAPFQGFVVTASGGAGYITMQEADKNNSTGTFYRMLEEVNEGSSYLEFSTAEGGYSKSWLSFRQDGEIGSDDRDAKKIMPLMASSRLVSLTHNGENSLDINNVPFNHEETISIPLDVMSLSAEDNNYVTSSTEVSMNWNLDNLPEHIDLTLVDNLTGEMVYLNNEMSHNFTTESKGSFGATYDNAVTIYPMVGESRFTLNVTYSALDNDPIKVTPSEYALNPVYPNPFNPSATIQFNTPEVSRVELQVFDVKGALVETLLNQLMLSGQHQYTWQPKSLPTGTYFLKLITNNQTFTQKVTYVK
jgi:hypothetical protein